MREAVKTFFRVEYFYPLHVIMFSNLVLPNAMCLHQQIVNTRLSGCAFFLKPVP